MTSIGRREEFQKDVFQIPNKSRITQRGSREDCGHSSVQATKRSGTELSATHLKGKWDSIAHTDGGTHQRNWSPRIQEHQCSESWNSEKKRWQRYHTLQCGFIENRALVSHNSLSKSGQSHTGAVSGWCEEFGQKRPTDRESTSVRFVAKENEQLLKSVKPQEVNSLVQTPRSDNRASGNRLRECFQRFENTGERHPIYESL